MLEPKERKDAALLTFRGLTFARLSAKKDDAYSKHLGMDFTAVVERHEWSVTLGSGLYICFQVSIEPDILMLSL